jgi:hypothetical protein
MENESEYKLIEKKRDLENIKVDIKILLKYVSTKL